MLDKRAYIGRLKRLTKRNVIVALVGRKVPKVASVPQGDLRTDSCFIRSFHTTGEVKNRPYRRVYNKRRLDHPY